MLCETIYCHLSHDDARWRRSRLQLITITYFPLFYCLFLLTFFSPDALKVWAFDTCGKKRRRCQFQRGEKKVKKKRVIQIQTCFASVKLSLSIDIPRRSQIERNRNAEEIGGETAVK